MITQMLQITRFFGIYLSSNSHDDGTFRDGKFSHFCRPKKIELISFELLIKVNRQLVSHLRSTRISLWNGTEEKFRFRPHQVKAKGSRSRQIAKNQCSSTA